MGDDLAEGKPTLPLLHAMRHGNPQQAALIREAIEQGGKRDAIDEVLAIMEEHKSSITQWIVRNKKPKKPLMPLPYYLKANTKSLNFTGLFIGRPNLLI